MIEPWLGFTRPMMHFISVDLPLPLVPSSTTVSPPSTLSDTSSMTRTAPYDAWIPAMVRLLAKIGPLHFRIAHDVVGLAIGDLAAGDQHDEAARKTHHRTHDMLDEDDGDALFV